MCSNPFVSVCSLLLVTISGSGEEFNTAGKSYLSFDIGVALQSDLQVKQVGGNSLNGVDLQFDTGLRFDIASGYHFTERFGAELSVGYVFNSVDGVTGVAPPGFGVDADLFQVPVMVNLIYKVRSELPIEPFLGGGAGGVLSVFSDSTGTREEFAFGYQGFVGAKYRLSPRTEFTAVYKILGTTDLVFAGFETGGTLTHTFAIGVRCSF